MYLPFELNIMADITGRQDAAQKCMKNISSLLQGTDDPDHVLLLLTQASAALKAVSPPKVYIDFSKINACHLIIQPIMFMLLLYTT